MQALRGQTGAIVASLLLAASCTLLPGSAKAADRVVRCGSDGVHRVHCPMDTAAGVEMVRQLSERPCIRGTDWDADAHGVWVVRGCEAEFAAVARVDVARRQMISCGSRGRLESCAVALRGAPVRLLRQTSALPCRRDESWGVRRNEIWVSRGCRGEFEIGGRDGRFPPGERLLHCESKGKLKRSCGTTIERGARLLRQLSGMPCEEGSSWGWHAEGVWVDHGCRAEFAVE